MSYLDPTRLHFAGRFQANVSTVNNDPMHFDNSTFQPEFQEMQTATADNGWWNPQGDGNWRLIGCDVTAAWIDGAPAGPADPVLDCSVADSDKTVPAKLVDLDSQQQMASQIWGLTVRIADADGNTLVEGKFAACPFTNLWNRATGSAAGDFGMGAEWQSVLTDVEWSPQADASPMLARLKKASAPGMLSIKFNVDGYTMASSQENFSTGRIVGTIGPYYAGEPHHLVIGRHMLANYIAITPAGKINHCVATIDATTGLVLVDLGNALPTDRPGGKLADIGDLSVGWLDPRQQRAVASAGISKTYLERGWYSATAGIVALRFSTDPLSVSNAFQLAVFNGDGSASVSENSASSYVRADQFVYRLAPGADKADSVEAAVWAMQFGAPLEGAEIAVRFDNSQLGADPPQPPTCTPLDAVVFPNQLTTDAQGKATLTITAADPGTPRNFAGGSYGIDGQIYGVRPSFADPDLAAGQVNMWDFISLLVHSAWAPASNPPAWADVQPIMQQYANLYPVMNRFLDLADKDSVKGNLYLLKLAFQLPIDNPNHMPVTRDLSPAKRAAIISVLDALGSEPAAGEAIPRPPAKASGPASPSAVGAQSIAVDAVAGPALGGKTAALMRAGVLPPREGDDQ